MWIFSICILISATLIYLIFQKVPNIKLYLFGIYTLSICISYFEVIQENPYKMFWTCNIISLLPFFLLIRFNQTIFDIFFFCAWSSSIFPMLIWAENYIPAHWYFASAYWLKHSLHAVIGIYYIVIEKKFLSSFCFLKWLTFVVFYISFVYFYNTFFNQNILELRQPITGIAKLVNSPQGIVLGMLWITYAFGIPIYYIMKKLKKIEVRINV